MAEAPELARAFPGCGSRELVELAAVATRLETSDPGALIAEIAGCARSDSAAAMLLGRMIDHGAIERVLTARELLSEASAACAMRSVYAVRPEFDTRLLRYALAQADAARLSRALRLLSGVSDGKRLLMILLPSMRTSDATVRAQAAAMIARWTRNLAWVSEQLGDADPRVRANVVESAAPWLEDTGPLRTAARDTHHRVACNAVLALLRRFDEEALPLLEKVLAREEWRFRAAGAWAIGASHRPDLYDRAAALRHDAHASVRWNALRAMAALKRVAGQRDASAAQENERTQAS